MDTFRGVIDFLTNGSAEDKIIALIFVFICILFLLFEWLYIRECKKNRHLLSLLNKDKTPKKVLADNTTLIANTIKAPSESFTKIISKAFKIASVILPVTHKTKSPEPTDITQDMHPPISGESNINTRIGQTSNQSSTCRQGILTFTKGGDKKREWIPAFARMTLGQGRNRDCHVVPIVSGLPRNDRGIVCLYPLPVIE